MTTPDKTSSLNIYFRLLDYVKPHWKIFALSLIGFLIFAATQPVFAALMKYMVDALNGNQRDTIYWIPLASVGIVLVRGAGSFLGSYFIALVSNKVVHTLRCQLFDHYTLLPSYFFDDNSSGHLISRITYNVQQVTGAATDAVKVLAREGFTVIGLFGYLFYMNWKLSLIFIAIAPLIGMVVKIATQRFRSISKKIQSSMGDLTHVASEMVVGNRVVKSFGGESYEQERFHGASKYSFQQSMRMVKTSAIQTPVLQLIISIALGTLIFLALLLMKDATTGEFIAYIIAAGLIPRPIRQLSEINATIQKGITAAESVFEVLDQDIEKNTGSHSTERIQGALEFKALSYRYNSSEKQILDNISFKLEAGKTIALVGHSGSGKTTLANLIPRFYDHTQGSILLDGVEINDYELNNLRSHISLVTQHVTLFNDTIERNIAYGSLGSFSKEQVIEAATKAHAMEFIEQLPAGLDTLIGENGLKLSGGQRQRLAIARALLKDAPVLILDEATSALDTESERKIQEALETAMDGKTTLIIAHRLSTIENADTILVMKNGKIVESGTHHHLLSKNETYAHLHKTQFKPRQ
ncbi:MAG: lipid ABC transporter permease/ATP-binding protein [Cycloclasticus sp. symbiont of Poecilosclerida sp. N]|nr:MAG: lipid ABC transporter permease/ATP-binding protein [Cycloclasticus sp. symbiont of Poecilosclerida sp. N]